MAQLSTAPVARVGVDLSKRLYQVHAIDRSGGVVMARPLSADRFFAWCAELPTGARVILADRDIKNHKDKVQAVFGDAHTKPLKADSVALPGETMGVLGVPGYAVFNPDAKGAFDQADDLAASALTKDNIFTFTGDAANAAETLIPGNGNATRACIR